MSAFKWIYFSSTHTQRKKLTMDTHLLTVLLISVAVLASIYLSYVNLDQRLRELSAEQSVLSSIVAPQDKNPGLEGDVTFIKLADILSGGQHAPEGPPSMPTIIEEAEENALNEDGVDEVPTEQVGVRKRRRGAGEIKTGG